MKQAKSDDVSHNAPYGYGLAELQNVLEVGVGVLVWLATEWASVRITGVSDPRWGGGE